MIVVKKNLKHNEVTEIEKLVHDEVIPQRKISIDNYTDIVKVMKLILGVKGEEINKYSRDYCIDDNVVTIWGKMQDVEQTVKGNFLGNKILRVRRYPHTTSGRITEYYEVKRF